jgi:hypothetical protein
MVRYCPYHIFGVSDDAELNFPQPSSQKSDCFETCSPLIPFMTIQNHPLDVIGWDEVLHQEIAKINSCLESYPKLTAVYHRDRTAAIAVSP